MHNSQDDNEQVTIIILANQPQMMRQMLQRVLEQTPSMYQVLNAESIKRVRSLLQRINAHWLVVSLKPNGTLSADAQRVMADHPDLAVLAVSDDGEQIEVYRPHTTVEVHHDALQHVTLQDILSVLNFGSLLTPSVFPT